MAIDVSYCIKEHCRFVRNDEISERGQIFDLKNQQVKHE